MSYYTIDGFYHSNINNNKLFEKFSNPPNNTSINIPKNIMPAIKEFKKDIVGALNMLDDDNTKNDLYKITAFLNNNKLLRFYDKQKNQVILKINDKNDICITKGEREICLKENDFNINVDNKINNKIKKQNKILKQKINESKELNINYPKSTLPKIIEKKQNIFINY